MVMKRLLTFLIVVSALVPALAAKGYIAGLAGIDYGTVKYTYKYGNWNAYDFSNYTFSTKGCLFFDSGENHGFVYKLGIGSCRDFHDDLYGEELDGDIDLVSEYAVGYGIMIPVKGIRLFADLMPSILVFHGADSTVLYNLGLSISYRHDVNENFGIIGGLDITIVMMTDYKYSSRVQPKDDTGMIYTPYIGCAYHY